ncbi:MAG: hypothetical protein U0P30_09420 [Vicinamibacterales bacterium]
MRGARHVDTHRRGRERGDAARARVEIARPVGQGVGVERERRHAAAPLSVDHAEAAGQVDAAVRDGDPIDGAVGVDLERGLDVAIRANARRAREGLSLDAGKLAHHDPAPAPVVHDLSDLAGDDGKPAGHDGAGRTQHDRGAERRAERREVAADEEAPSDLGGGMDVDTAERLQGAGRQRARDFGILAARRDGDRERQREGCGKGRVTTGRHDDTPWGRRGGSLSHAIMRASPYKRQRPPGCPGGRYSNAVNGALTSCA